MKIFFLLLGLCAISFQTAIAQSRPVFKKGYVKSLDGKDVYGYIGNRIEGKPQKIQFKENENDDIGIYSALEIKGYGFENGSYYSAYRNSDTNKNDCVFLEFIVEGEISVVGNMNFYFVKKSDSKEFVFLDPSNKEFVKKLRAMMKNCPYIRYKAQFLGADLDKVSEVVRQYNECAKNNTVSNEGLPNQIMAGVVVGCDYTNSSISTQASSLKYLAVKPIQDQNLFQGGFTFTFRKNSLSALLGINTGILYSQNAYRGTRELINNKANEITEYRMSYSELKVPAGIEFRPPTKSKISHFLKAGVTIPIVLNFSSTALRGTDTGGSVYFNREDQIESLKKGVQVTLGLGLDYKIFGAKKVRLEMGWSSGSGRFITRENAIDNSIRFQSFSVLGGFIF